LERWFVFSIVAGNQVLPWVEKKIGIYFFSIPVKERLNSAGTDHGEDGTERLPASKQPVGMGNTWICRDLGLGSGLSQVCQAARL